MNSKQMKKWLEQQGATFLQKKGFAFLIEMFDYPVTLTPDDNGTVLVTLRMCPRLLPLAQMRTRRC